MNDRLKVVPSSLSFSAALASSCVSNSSPSVFVRRATFNLRFNMAMPGDMLCEPTEKIIFNAPFIDKYKIPFRMTNDGAKTVGWAIKTNCPARISADPPCGVLDPKGKAILYVTCEPFDYQSTDVSADRITIEWVLTPANAGKQFQRAWFQGDTITRRKNVPINYNY